MQRELTFIDNRRWKLIETVIPQRPPSTVGRKPAKNRDVLEGILYVILRNKQWMELPPGLYPPYTTCFRRYTSWIKSGVWENILDVLFEDTRDRTGIDLWKLWSNGTLRQKQPYGRRSRLMPLNELFSDPGDMIVGLLFYKNTVAMMEEEDRRGVKA